MSKYTICYFPGNEIISKCNGPRERSLLFNENCGDLAALYLTNLNVLTNSVWHTNISINFSVPKFVLRTIFKFWNYILKKLLNEGLDWYNVRIPVRKTDSICGLLLMSQSNHITKIMECLSNGAVQQTCKYSRSITWWFIPHLLQSR